MHVNLARWQLMTVAVEVVLEMVAERLTDASKLRPIGPHVVQSIKAPPETAVLMGGTKRHVLPELVNNNNMRLSCKVTRGNQKNVHLVL